MKKGIILLCVLLIASVLIFREVKNQVKEDLAEPVSYPSTTITIAPSDRYIPESQVTQSLFVPYWAQTNALSHEQEYQEYLYFGVVPGSFGINTQEEGAIRATALLADLPPGVSVALTVRMLDSGQNSAILKEDARQKELIASTVSFAKEHGFTGIVLDLEMSAIPFDSLVQQITLFTKDFATEAKREGLSFSLMSYGDTFYRLRPFALKELASSVDMVRIMAYDFHKSRGNPGPNFPLEGKEVYGYDMTAMIDDYLAVVPAEKIQVVFGMFGYDWIVDDKENRIENGDPITYNEIQQTFLSGCSFADCTIKRKNDSSETKITYTDAQSKQHVVWFEDATSVAEKQEYLKKRGISSFGYWAYSYF
ncbi:MAG: glycosyl hydrolase family 18 protein [Patescibacteria group bacterium]